MAGTILNKKLTVVKPIPVKGHLSSTGTPVEPYQYRHKVADKEATTRRLSPEELPQAPTTKKPKEVSEKESGVASVIHTDNAQLLVSDARNKHSSEVYAIPDDYGRTGYFKPKSGEVWSYEHNKATYPFRMSMTEDRLADKEVLTSKLAKELHVDGVPETTYTHVHHKGQDLGEGSIQMDAQTELAQKGFSEEQIRFSESEMYDHEKWAREKLPMMPEELTHQRRQSAFKNGGMDLAFFDFIIGNADRHGNNLFVGTNPETGEQKYMGIDHGLSFPHTNQLLEADYPGTLERFWNKAITHGSGIDCTEEFKKTLRDKGITKKIENHLKGSSLKQQEIDGTLFRLRVVKDHLDRHGTLTGRDLKSVISNNLQGSSFEDEDKWLPPETFKPKVKLYQGGHRTATTDLIKKVGLAE